MLSKKQVDGFIQTQKKAQYQVKENISIKAYTSLHIGGNVRLFVEPKSVDELSCTIQNAKRYEIPYFIIGNGSNVLFSDQGFNGLIIVTKSRLTKLFLVDETSIIAQAGVSLKSVCEFALQHHLTGLEFAYGIPATVGGAVFMNAGAYGGEIKDVLYSCTYLDGEGKLQTIQNEAMDFSYRHSFFSDKKVVILEACFVLVKGDVKKIKERMEELLALRKSKQPLEYPSAGSTFKRPLGNYASALIEQAGYKGFRHKRAMVSAKHAGFVINHANATSEEFLELIEIVKKGVKEKTGYELECEIRIIQSHEDI
ncbi:MAG: UDP-N-acetylmuramate dehydrogenase [Breznakia sp.]